MESNSNRGFSLQRNTQSSNKILTKQTNSRMTNESSTRRVKDQYTSCSINERANTYTIAEENIYDFDLCTIIEKYGDYSELLELILSCKLQEDRRKTEEAKLKQKEIDYFLSNQEDASSDTDKSPTFKKLKLKERVSTSSYGSTASMNINDATPENSNSFLGLNNELLNHQFRTNNRDKKRYEKVNLDSAAGTNFAIKTNNAQINRYNDDINYSDFSNQSNSSTINLDPVSSPTANRLTLMNKAVSHTLPPLLQNHSNTQNEERNNSSFNSIHNISSEGSVGRNFYSGVVQQDSPCTPNIGPSRYSSSKNMLMKGPDEGTATSNRNNFPNRLSTGSEELLLSSENIATTEAFPKMPINRLIRYNSTSTSDRPRRRQKLLQAITMIIETKEFPYDDGYTWKNNGNTVHKTSGQKSIYYKCSNSSLGCPVNKTVAFGEDGKYLIKYRGYHLDECTNKSTSTGENNV